MKRIKTRQRYLHRASLHDARHDNDDDVHAYIHLHIVTLFHIFTLTSFPCKLSQKLSQFRMSQSRCPCSACPRTAVPVPHVPEPRVPIPAICILLQVHCCFVSNLQNLLLASLLSSSALCHYITWCLDCLRSMLKVVGKRSRGSVGDRQLNECGKGVAGIWRSTVPLPRKFWEYY